MVIQLICVGATHKLGHRTHLESVFTTEFIVIKIWPSLSGLKQCKDLRINFGRQTVEYYLLLWMLATSIKQMYRHLQAFSMPSFLCIYGPMM